jgi:hypothetical protein
MNICTPKIIDSVRIEHILLGSGRDTCQYQLMPVSMSNKLFEIIP